MKCNIYYAAYCIKLTKAKKNANILDGLAFPEWDNIACYVIEKH